MRHESPLHAPKFNRLIVSQDFSNLIARWERDVDRQRFRANLHTKSTININKEWDDENNKESS